MVNESNTPLVSVLMTAYNREKYIGEAIESVLASTFTDFELIIVDDCSKDNTVAIAQKYAAEDDRIKVYVNEKNLGDYPNRNKAASYAIGKYLKYVDSDDKITDQALLKMLEAFHQFPNAALVFSANQHDSVQEFPIEYEPIGAYRKFFYNNGLLHKGPSAAMIDAKVFADLGGFMNQQFISDTHLWLRIAQKHNVVLVIPDLIFWREHEEQQIFLETLNPIVEKIRLSSIEDILLSVNNPLSLQESKQIVRNLKNIKCRSILKLILELKFKEAHHRFKLLNLTVFDIFKSFLPNRIVAN